MRNPGEVDARGTEVHSMIRLEPLVGLGAARVAGETTWSPGGGGGTGVAGTSIDISGFDDLWSRFKGNLESRQNPKKSRQKPTKIRLNPKKSLQNLSVIIVREQSLIVTWVKE